MREERWAWIPGYEYKYKVSTQGRVKNIGGRLLTAKPVNKIGHLQVHLYKDGASHSKYVHRAVLEAFVGPCPNGMQCRHLNGIATDNRLENLKWGTPSEDNFDRIRHGTHQHAAKTHCKHGHALDGVYLRPDGSVKQRICLTCRRKHNREMKAKAREARQTCPQGHPFDGVRYNADGTVRQRYCTICAHDALDRGRQNRWHGTT